MPLIRVSVPHGKSSDYRKGVGKCIHDAMVETINVPDADRFQIITEHHSGDLVIDSTYLDVARSGDAIIVQITLRRGRSVAQKRALYQAIARNLNERVGLRIEDVTICLVENDLIDWSFGNGEAQIAPA